MFTALGRRASGSTIRKRKPLGEGVRLKERGMPIIGGDATTVWRVS